MPLALCLVWAAPARADVAVPQPAAKKTWRDGCAARIDAAAKKAGLKPGARASVIPLRRENGTPNPVQYIEYGNGELTVTAGEEPETRPDVGWTNIDPINGRDVTFRRLHNRFGKIDGRGPFSLFRQALDDCLQMGEAK